MNITGPKEIIPPKHRLAMARAAVGDSTVGFVRHTSSARSLPSFLPSFFLSFLPSFLPSVSFSLPIVLLSRFFCSLFYCAFHLSIPGQWLTVDPWEITRKRVMDYMSVLDHVQTLFEACFPELPVKLIYLCNSDMMMKLSPDDLRERGFGCLCVCRPQETDRLLHHMGSRWKDVAYVVEDAAILSRK